MSEDEIKFWGFVAQWIGLTLAFFTSLIALRNSRIAQKSFKLDKRPYLALDKIELVPYHRAISEDEINIVSFTSIFRFKNIGKTIANFEIKDCVVNVYEDNETEVTSIDKDCKEKSRLLPGIDDIGYYLNIKGMFPDSIEGKIEFTIIYYRDENEEKYEWKMKIEFNANLSSRKINFDIIEDKERIVAPKGIIDRISDFLGI